MGWEDSPGGGVAAASALLVPLVHDRAVLCVYSQRCPGYLMGLSIWKFISFTYEKFSLVIS